MPFLPLVTRLTRQLSAKGESDPHTLAIEILREHKLVKQNSEELTVAGKRRQAMGPAARAIDRAARQTGHDPKHYKYVPGKGARLK